MPTLNSASPIPLYRQLAERIAAGIRSGQYAPGDKIPSEPALARAFGIGRPTVRQATDLLVRRQKLERRRGSGTFVVEPPEQVDLFSLAGTLASFRRQGIAVRSSLLERPRVVAVGPDAENPFAGREAYRLVRLSRVGRDPVLLEVIHLDAERFAGLEKVSLAGRSLSQWVEEHFHMRPESADQNFRIHAPDAEHAEALGLAGDAPVLLVKRSLHFAGLRDGIFAELFCRTDRLVFSQTLTAPPAH